MDKDISPPLSPITRIGSDTAQTMLAASGMLAAFGVASCCALPIALSFLGISAASLVGIGYLAAPYQQELLYAAVAFLSAAALVIWQRRRARCSASGGACLRPLTRWTSLAALAFGFAFLALTFWYEPPI